jgi:hypothetical protein
MNLLNMNPERYIIEGYCLKYPTDPGVQNINEEDVVPHQKTTSGQTMKKARNGNSLAPLVSPHMEHVNSAGQVDQPTNNVQTAPCTNIQSSIVASILVTTVQALNMRLRIWKVLLDRTRRRTCIQMRILHG